MTRQERRAKVGSAWYASAMVPFLLALATAPLPAAAQEPIGASAAAQDASRRAITHEDVWLAKRLGTPAVSPDGARAVVAVTEPSYEADGQSTNLWLVATDGSTEPRRLTSSRGTESGVVWSPDGGRLAFSARREGDDVSQIYVLDLAGGGEAQRVTSVATGAASPQWRPDGGAILFASTLYRDAADMADHERIADEREARNHRARVYDGFPIRNWDRWLEDTQPRLYVQPLSGGAEPRALLDGSALIAETGFAGAGADLGATWTPDGQGVVFVATTRRDALAYSSPAWHLYHVDVNGGEPRLLTPGADSYNSPTFPADGRRLYATFNPGTDFVYNHTRLAVFSWPEPGDPTILTSDWDRSVSSFVLAGDGGTIYMVAQDAGHDRVFSMPASGGAVRPLAAEQTGVYGGLAVAGSGRSAVLVSRWESAVSPPELVRVDAANGTHRALTAFNADVVANVDLHPLRPFWFTSERGVEIHSFLALPPDYFPLQSTLLRRH